LKKNYPYKLLYKIPPTYLHLKHECDKKVLKLHELSSSLVDVGSSTLSYKHLTEKHLNYTLVISSNIEPQSFEQACRQTE